jgi:hypothetical protein
MAKKPYIILSVEQDDIDELEHKVKNHLENEYLIFGTPFPVNDLICQAMILNDPSIAPKITYYRI